jgi:hypothetical protein
MKRIMAVVPLIGLSGCILVAQQAAEQGQTQLVGK